MPSYDPNNIFAKILRGEMPCHRVYEDDKALAFLDIMPRAPGHTLVLPKSPARNILDVAPDDLAHARFDLFEILGRERLTAGKVVIKAGFGRRPEGHLGVGIELLDCLGHDVRRVMPQDFQPLGTLAGDNSN